MTSTLNPYVVDLSIHTEALFGLIKSKKVQPEATPGAPKAPARAGLSGMFKSKKAQPEATPGAPKAPARSTFNPFKKKNASELFAKYAADTKKYSLKHLDAVKQDLGMFVCYYLVTPEKLLRCSTGLAPGWGGSMKEMQSGTIRCSSLDVVSNNLGDMIDVPYPHQNVLWMSSRPK